MKEVKYLCGCGYKPELDKNPHNKLLSNRERVINHSKETGHCVCGKTTVKLPVLTKRVEIRIQERKRTNVELLLERSSD